MKKIITALLLAGILLSGASCGRNKDKNLDSTSSSSSQSTQDTSDSGGETATDMNAKSFLHSVYGAFLTNMAPIYEVGSAEEVKGYFAGPETETVTEKDPDTGEDYSYELPKNEPGEVSVSEADDLESLTLFPASSADKLDSAAVFFNLMNQNNGTFAAVRVKNGSDMQALADMMKSKIRNNQWICGFPERYQILRVGDIMVFSYGLNDALAAWKNAVSSVYSDVAVLYDETL